MDESLWRDLLQTREQAERLYSQRDIETAIARMAADITSEIAAENPLLLCVLNGAIMPFAQLLKHLDFPLQTDYVHATRYGEKLTGEGLYWLARPATSVHGRTVVIVDDILDEGITLAAIEQTLQQKGAEKILKAVLVQKQLPQPAATTADFVGLTVPDRYVFGYGMDYKGYWRNLPGIYAVKRSE